METTYAATSPDADDLSAAIQQWVLTQVCPELAERGLLPPEAAAMLLSVRSMDTPAEQRRAVGAQLRATPLQDREVSWLLASVLDPRWTLDPVSLPDVLIARLGLRRVVELARADEVVLAALVRHHPRVAAMDKVLDAITLVLNELAGRDWSPESQRLTWAAARAAEKAGLSVTITTSWDELRLLIVDSDDGEVLLDSPYRAGVDQDGYRVQGLDLRPVITEILALDASLPHSKDAIWPDGASERREDLYVRAWYMARAAGWQVGIDHVPADPERLVVAVVTLPSGVQLRGRVRRGRLPEDGAVIPWDGRPRDMLGVAAWLVGAC
jgi:hypothetical protein